MQGLECRLSATATGLGFGSVVRFKAASFKPQSPDVARVAPQTHE